MAYPDKGQFDVRLVIDLDNEAGEQTTNMPVESEGRELVAEVVTVQKHRRAIALYPVDKAKFIISKVSEE